MLYPNLMLTWGNDGSQLYVYLSITYIYFLWIVRNVANKDYNIAAICLCR